VFEIGDGGVGGENEGASDIEEGLQIDREADSNAGDVWISPYART
jgi:hypothetical protein